MVNIPINTPKPRLEVKADTKCLHCMWALPMGYRTPLGDTGYIHTYADHIFMSVDGGDSGKKASK